MIHFFWTLYKGTEGGGIHFSFNVLNTRDQFKNFHHSQGPKALSELSHLSVKKKKSKI